MKIIVELGTPAEATQFSASAINAAELLNSRDPVVWRNVLSSCDKVLLHAGNAE